jgi:transcriptional regulator with XRE-family HTH domain
MNENEIKFREILALNIRVARTRKQITQETLAELAGISVKHVTKIENAQVTTSIYFVYRIAKALDVTIDELVTEYKK